MDAKKLGLFIAKLRKEKNMTQAALAKQLNVTDKAVSRWERGLGFPDINTIEPLSEALDVSILEIMKGERIVEEQVDKKESLAVYHETVEMMNRNWQKKRTRKLILSAIVVVILFIYFLQPLHLADAVIDSEKIEISYVVFHIEEGVPIINTNNYSLKRGSMEYIAFLQTLKLYDYHRNWKTPWSDSSLEGGDFYFTIWSYTADKKESSQCIVISPDKNIIVNGHTYTLGYGGDKTAEKLYYEIMDIINQLEPARLS